MHLKQAITISNNFFNFAKCFPLLIKQLLGTEFKYCFLRPPLIEHSTAGILESILFIVLSTEYPSFKNTAFSLHFLSHETTLLYILKQMASPLRADFMAEIQLPHQPPK